MKVLFKAQIRDDDDDRLFYDFTEDRITVTYKGKTDVFDFTDFGNGKLQTLDEEYNSLVETELEYQPLREAERKNGILYVILMNFIGPDATHEECFPDWIDHTEYSPPVIESIDGGEANG